MIELQTITIRDAVEASSVFILLGFLSLASNYAVLVCSISWSLAAVIWIIFWFCSIVASTKQID